MKVCRGAFVSLIREMLVLPDPPLWFWSLFLVWARPLYFESKKLASFFLGICFQTCLGEYSFLWVLLCSDCSTFFSSAMSIWLQVSPLCPHPVSLEDKAEEEACSGCGSELCVKPFCVNHVLSQWWAFCEGGLWDQGLSVVRLNLLRDRAEPAVRKAVCLF